MKTDDIFDRLIKVLKPLQFGPPVAYVYNPLLYARKTFDIYMNRYGRGPKDIVLVGMNPGPWGMAQTGIPFGEVEAVKSWLRIEAPVGRPSKMHPKRLVEGFGCRRREVSGQRLWGWARKTFVTPERFFSRFFVANYCPLLFVEKSGRNITPDKLPVADRKPLLEACDRALCDLVSVLTPKFVIGVGSFAEGRARVALADQSDQSIVIGKIAHPSPANPRANRGWEDLVAAELKALGISV